MQDTESITKALAQIYGASDWVMNLNFRLFLFLTGLTKFSRTSRILDCGCGMGHLIRIMGNHGFTNAHGLDASPEMVRNAWEITGRSITCGDVLNMSSLWANPFDAILALHLFHHIGKEKQWETFICECRRSLRNRGILVIREPFPTPLFNTLRWMARHRIFFRVRLLSGRLQSLIEEKDLLDYFLAHWSPLYKMLLEDNGFDVMKDFNLLGDRITVCQRRT